MARILCVDDESAALAVFKSVLEDADHRVVGVTNVDAALTVLERGKTDLVVSDYQMPDRTGLELLAEIERRDWGVPVVMVTGYGSIQHAVAAFKAGAVDYVTKPIQAAQLQLTVEQALEMERLRTENKQLRSEVQELRGRWKIVGDSDRLRRVLDTIDSVAPTRASVLLQGESGTGKELLARAIHARYSAGDERPFVSVNCAALPESLVESTLFGHEKGAFTGAVKQTKGAFERADGGTLLLDEISEMRLDLQAKLLRVLQESEFERVGGTETIRVDVRIIATTNRSLAEEVSEGRFREDLYYRLSVVPIRVPPLRERADDIPRLARHFAGRTARDIGRSEPDLTPEAMELLQDYPWPGNVRELAHTVERAVILSGGEGELRPEHFDPDRFGLALPGGKDGGPGSGPVPSRRVDPRALDEDAVLLDTLNLDDVEARLIEEALERTEGNRTRAAGLLGISPRTLRNKLNK
jgi:DNA-binding NtrC family response regulator